MTDHHWPDHHDDDASGYDAHADFDHLSDDHGGFDDGGHHVDDDLPDLPHHVDTHDDTPAPDHHDGGHPEQPDHDPDHTIDGGHPDDGAHHDPEFPPTVDIGPLPDPVDGFPWIDTATLGATPAAVYAAPSEPVEPHELAAYAATELPESDQWAALANSDDPATAALARWWAENQP